MPKPNLEDFIKANIPAGVKVLGRKRVEDVVRRAWQSAIDSVIYDGIETALWLLTADPKAIHTPAQPTPK